ncbi:MAG: polyprenyl synthetase family protein, partial [Halobacteria archaeon]|nr:polyprenyl synthetase family protein [Halobacteria archaeon]
MSAEEYRELKDTITHRAEIVDSVLEDMLPLGSPDALYEASSYLFEAGGKRLRPAIVLLVAEALG